MNLIYNEYIDFLKNKGMKYNLKEGYYWYDKSIIKAYDKNGNIHKILRLKVNDDLSIEFKEYKNKYFEIESWYDTIERRKEEILELEKHSIELIKTSISIFDDRIISIPSSGGKDSGVVTYLVRQVSENPLIIFNNTTLDVADTYLHIKKENNLKIITPKEGFYKWRKRNNFIPTRFSRACCSIFKEKEMVDTLNKGDKYLFFMGMRNDESSTRSGYGDIWKNNKWGNREWDAILPIRNWREEDIWLYVLMRNIDINNKYKKGYNRVGCGIACPFYSKHTWALDKYWYPFLYNRWHNILEEDFIKNKKAPIMNCTLKEYHICWNGGRVRDEVNKEVIEEFSQQQNLNYDIAKKYFDKKCVVCNKKLKKDDIGLSMKLYGRNIENFKCVRCLGKEFNKTNEELKEIINYHKNNGCDLF